MVVPFFKKVERKMYFNVFLSIVCPDGNRRLRPGIRGYDHRLKCSGSGLLGQNHGGTVLKHARDDGCAPMFTEFQKHVKGQEGIHLDRQCDHGSLYKLSGRPMCGSVLSRNPNLEFSNFCFTNFLQISTFPDNLGESNETHPSN